MRWMNSSELKRWVFYFLLILAGIVAYVAINNYVYIIEWIGMLLTAFSPFIAGIVIAYLLDIPCSKIEKRMKTARNSFIRAKARGLSVLVVYAVVLAAIVILLSIILPEIVKSVVEFATNVPVYYEMARSFLLDLIENDSIVNQIDWESIQKSLTVSSVLEALGIENLRIASVWQSLLGLFSVSAYLLNVVLAVISSIYLLLEASTMKAFASKLLKAFIPEKNASVFTKYFHKTNMYLKQYVYCLLVDGLIVGVVSVVGLSVVGARYAVVLGVVEGVTNMIPYFGAIVGTIIVVVVVLFADGFGKAMAVLVILFILQQIDGNIIKPKLFGDSFDISPFLVILSITVGGSYYGVIGMVIAIPLVAVLKNIVCDLLDYRIAKQKEKGNAGGLT